MYDVVTNRQEEIDEKRDEVCVILSKAGQCYRRLVWKRHHDLVRTMPTCPLRVIVFLSPPITLPCFENHSACPCACCVLPMVVVIPLAW
jgi:hypothetical protein